MPFPGSPLDRLNHWKQHGTLRLYYFHRQHAPYYSYWNLYADREACDSVHELLALLLEFERSRTKEILVAPLSDKWKRAESCRSGKIKSPSVWRIASAKGIDSDNTWRWEGDRQTPTLVAGRAKLIELQKAFKLVAENVNDFRVGSDDPHVREGEFAREDVWFF